MAPKRDDLPPKPLTATWVSHKRPEGAYGDGKGLFLVVTAAGTKSWRLRYWIDKKEFVHTLGRYEPGSADHMGLDDARTAAKQAKASARQGAHPKDVKRAEEAAKKAEQALTFEGVAEEYVQHMKIKKGWQASTEAGFRISLNASINPIIGPLPVGKVDVDHIKKVLNQSRLVGKRIAQTVALSVIRRVLRYAKLSKYITVNNADGLEELLPERKKGEPRFKHHAAFKTQEALREYLTRLDANNDRTSSLYGLRLLTLLPVRVSELATMKWSALETNPGFWVYEMPKVHRQHIVPLPKQALAILDELRAQRMGQCEYVLPGRYADRPINPESFRLALLNQLGYDVGAVTPHGMRATFQTLARKHLHVDTVVLELMLGHETSAAFNGAYDRNDFLEERIETAKRWADWLDTLRGATNDK
ncbi:tyrosine-type recombinase/integrase [Pseudomonas umsongensis]|uniref:Integrase arm-type DNA-binding domain-containing protein n=1 Tax=Pseudomonas umsongensis TaxID=198618 RepID=A0AAE7DDC1_9PSED|nr:integrase arm-type DNA-binding domain-containing protein [Pseudomonas umsongensis]QJC78223.1 integrase arm-type DNA-binding domain-containing protein [Pseudomonas umsongensis]